VTHHDERTNKIMQTEQRRIKNHSNPFFA